MNKSNLAGNFSNGVFYRSSIIDKSAITKANESENGQQTRSLSLSFSSEEPVERFFGLDYNNGWYFEVLDHEETSVDLTWLKSGRAPLLLDHDPQKQIGIIETAYICSEKKGRAQVRFSKNKLAESVYQDVMDGIRANISVGYRYLPNVIIDEEKTQENNFSKKVVEKKSKKEIAENIKQNTEKIYRIKGWEALEISFVSIPADRMVGIGRHYFLAEQLNLTNKKQDDMTDTMITNTDRPTLAKGEGPEINNIALNSLKDNIRNDELTRSREILALGAQHNLTDSALEYVSNGKNVDSFRQYILEHLTSKQKTSGTINSSNHSDNALIGMSSKEAGSFSILRAIRAVANNSWQGAEFEKEASDTVAKQIGREPSSFFLPLDVMKKRNINGYKKRDMQKLGQQSGGYLVDTEYQAESFIDLLRNKMLVSSMGAKVLYGLKGDIAIPKQTGGATSFWVSEGQAISSSEQRFGQVTLSPKTIGAFTDFTRKLTLQASPDIEQLIREDLATTIALEIDRACLNGSGIGAEPLGILQHDGLETITINDDNPLDWGIIVDLETSIAAKNADLGNLAYIGNAKIRGLLKQTEKSEHTAQFVWENGGDNYGYLNGYRAYATNQMPADTLLFGNFADLIIANWGVLDVLVDPYTLGTSGSLRLRLMQDVDTVIRHIESFAVARRV